MIKLKKIEIEGYKSIRKSGFDLENINVLIGANGSGKSNLISLFKMLSYMSSEALQTFTQSAGGANTLLFYGSKFTPQMKVRLEFEFEKIMNTYYMRLTETAADTLIFSEERLEFLKPQFSQPKLGLVGSGHKETLLNEEARKGNKTAQFMRNILRQCQVFQFHDTSEQARIRIGGYVEDNQYLRKDAGNLAAYLYMLRDAYPKYYKRIVDTIRLIAPHFGDFVLKPDMLNANYIRLNWTEVFSDYLFGPHQLPDGLLRAMALITLLLQPEEFRPELIVIDEPELGLHPYAINILGALFREVSQCCQIFIATQSVGLLNQFNAEDVLVIQRKRVASSNQIESNIDRLKKNELDSWIKEEYTLGELWEKNILGGRPDK